ncbi:hypothetical protein A2996_02635 [Candidatus Campbellbacteria bacterium RIFCSPLOWO2_01_FULL_34_15]|uniref:Endolytic murein transglycosylase n=2 Tax=Candidatus Campbelliibacteriota TaxID=1752727 RepID=A0A1F5EP89_9BACT|nr:MAG: hypothetical protein A2811_00065 [Candidatus Campbellbacteria bacterium RIFCSPHIGHO2_01_FULL_34_10]OGD69208.1 MAG: hypothetical protein A2996_02635 [Candidatus Campbellbacteria bacterium RIFCSPLOWO2_01_FULL_34_15]
MHDLNFENYNPRNFFADKKIPKPKITREFLSENSSLIWELFFLCLIFLYSVYFLFINAPQSFPLASIIHIESGDTLRDISKELKDKRVIKSKTFFEITVIALGGEKSIIAGDYFFEEKKDAFRVANRLVNGYFGMDPMKVTLYEGLTVKEMSVVIAKKFSEFNPDEFIRLAEENNLEGYLFPDTYQFLPNISAIDVLRAMEINFYSKMTEIQEKISKSDKSLSDIIIMASLIEEEARTIKTRKMVSGILWNRIEIDMPLQVDAVFPYIIGKNTYEVNLTDLKHDSPYNTYKYKGLPPGPITNPGLNSILAAIEPIENDYLYYLSDRRGNLYYATNYKDHLLNKRLYMD